MKAKAVLMSLAAVVILSMGYSANAADTPAPLSTPELQQAIGSGKKTVVFFNNPMGHPCQAQKEILLKLQKDMGNKFNIAYVDSSKPSDQKAFYDYGVRGLPSLALVDSKGKIARVFPPGIQSYETLVQSLDSIK